MVSGKLHGSSICFSFFLVYVCFCLFLLVPLCFLGYRVEMIVSLCVCDVPKHPLPGVVETPGQRKYS